MKTKITIKKVGSALLFLFLMLFSVTSYSQACTGNNVTVTISGITNTPQNNTVDFDVYITNTGTTSIKLASFAGAVIHNVGFASAGTFTVLTQPSANDFPTLNAIATTAYTVASRQLRWTQNPVLESNAVTLPAGVAKKFARFRFVRTGSDFPFDFAATFTFQEYVQSGYTAVNPNVYCNGNTSSTALANGAIGPPAVNNGFLVVGGPYNFIVNQNVVCFTSGTYTQTPACATTNNDGTATITMASVPTNLSATYVLDSGSPTPVTLTAAGAFTLTGLAAGAHTLSVTGSGTCTTPVSVPFTINAAPSVTPAFTQVGPFCAGATLTPLPTTSTNGVTGTWSPALDNMNSGTYTFTPAVGQCATTATMTITINPTTNTTTTAAACDSYTWAANGTTYTTSGVYVIPATLPSGIVNNQTNWLNQATATGSTVSLNPLTGYPTTPPSTVAVGPVNVTFSAPSGLYSSGTFISTNTANQALTMTFSTPVYGVSGNYYVTNISDVAIAGTITITYSDGTTETQPVSADTDFFGYYKNAGITSVVITPVATTPAVNRWSTVKNLRIAVAPPCQTQTLNLTITPTTNTTTTISACDTYTWAENGTTYTTSGVYVVPGTPTNGIVNNQANWLSTAAANGASVSLNPLSGYPTTPPATVAIGPANVTFSAPSGLYSSGTFISTNTANQALTMTFSTPVYGVSGNYYVTNISDVAIAGTITITYSDGTTETQPVSADTDFFGYFKNTGITSVVITPVATTPAVNRWSTIKNLRIATSPSACITRTLNLTITPSTTNGSVTTTACGSYTWALPNGTGVTYTTSQTNLTNVVGCNTATLNLTITPNTNVTTTVSACDSYTWSENGTTYTTSGTYTIPGTLPNGIVNNQTNWLNQAAANGATVSLNTLAGVTAANPTVVTVGGVTATMSAAAGGMYSNGSLISTGNANTAINIAFSQPVYGVSGNYFVTNVSDVVIAGTITITYSDGTVDTQPVSADTDFFGYFKNTGITNIVLAPVATTPAVNRYVALKNLRVAVAPPCLTKTLNLTITPSTTNGSVTTSICAGGSYTWPGPNGTGATYTTAQTNLTNVVGCNTATLNLTVNPTTTNGSVTTSICSGSSYTWPLPNGTGATYTTTQTNLTNVVGCNTATLNLTVNTAATPTGSANQSFTVNNPNNATIANIVVSPAGVIWYGSLANAQTGTNPLPTSTVLTNGATYWAVNVVGACSSTPFAVTVTVTLGNDEFNSLNFTFYPNPTSSVLNISYSRTISDIQVMNLLGQQVMDKKTNDSEVQIDLSSLADATYFVKVTSEGKSKIIKVIKSN